MPGFSAEQSLQSSLSLYHGGSSYALHADDLVEPQIFGFIKEAAESIGNAFSSAASALADEVGKLVNSLQNSGPGGEPFVCGQWAARMLACSGNSPTYNEGQMMAACLSTNVAQAVACAGVTAALYSTLEQGCKDNPNGIGQLLGQVCPNG